MSRRVIVGVRSGSMRDRRGRGMRGPLSLPGPLTPRRTPNDRTGIKEFDALVESELHRLADHLSTRQPRVQVVIEDVPNLPPGFEDPIPHTKAFVIEGGVRVVVFRKPIMRDAKRHHIELRAAIVYHLTLELAQVWGCDEDELF